jgi:hypothetical protein
VVDKMEIKSGQRFQNSNGIFEVRNIDSISGKIKVCVLQKFPSYGAKTETYFLYSHDSLFSGYLEGQDKPGPESLEEWRAIFEEAQYDKDFKRMVKNNEYRT